MNGLLLLENGVLLYETTKATRAFSIVQTNIIWNLNGLEVLQFTFIQLKYNDVIYSTYPTQLLHDLYFNKKKEILNT